MPRIVQKIWSGKQASKQQNWNWFPWTRLASGHRNTAGIPFWGRQHFSINLESKERGRNNRNILRHNFKLNEEESPLIQGRWYKSSTTCKTKKETSGEETKAVCDKESTAGENKSEQKTRQPVLKNYVFTYGWTIPQPPTSDYLNAKISLFTSGPQRLLFSSLVGTRSAGGSEERVFSWRRFVLGTQMLPPCHPNS